MLTTIQNESPFGSDLAVPVFHGRLPLRRFLAKTVKVNKIAMKKLLKKLSFGVDFKL